MRNKYLLLGAASALMLAACSEDIKGPESNNKPVENALNLTSLSPESQAARVSLPGQTRGPKADRLQLVAKVGPVSTVADQKWSATGIAISGTTAYVSWHSDHQAKVPAESWGGAIDALNITELAKLAGAINPANVISSTQTSNRVKFNNVVADGSNLYFPMTCYINGAVVGRLAPGAEAMDTIGIPGSSANAVYVDGTNLYAATGYAGGVYRMPTNFTDETKFEVVAGGIENVSPMSNNFGGKYIANGTVLRTDDEKAYLLPLQGGAERALDVPLTSTQKYAEAYDPVEGDWYELTGDKAAHYGKHTMAIEGDYTYIGAGKNGLRVYNASGLVWNNNTNTTAVTVAEVYGSKYVFAATGAGLRVYNLYDSSKASLPIYAFEVKDYDANGMAADAPGSNQPEAGTTAHSSNFVAVDSQTGLIFVANGQSGVYVFKLVPSNETGFKTTTGIEETKDVKDGETVKVKAPEAPGVEKWEDEDGNVYIPGTEYPIESGTIILLDPVYKEYPVTYNLNGGEGTVPTDQKVKHGEKPVLPENDPTNTGKEFVAWSADGTNPLPEDFKAEGPVTLIALWKDHTYAYTLKFDGNKEEGITVSNLPGDIKSDDKEVTVPNMTPTVPEGTSNPVFIGWATDPEMSVAHKDAGLWTPIMPGAKYEFSAEGTVTLYAIWATNVSAGGNQGGVVEEKPDPSQGGAGGGAGDVNGEYVE